MHYNPYGTTLSRQADRELMIGRLSFYLAMCQPHVHTRVLLDRSHPDGQRPHTAISGKSGVFVVRPPTQLGCDDTLCRSLKVDPLNPSIPSPALEASLARELAVAVCCYLGL